MQESARMAELTWLQIETAFQHDLIVVVPLGAACKEHGYHLPMNTDLIVAETLADYVLHHFQGVLIAPPIIDSYFPVFIEYPGSCSLTLKTATNLVVQRCKIWYQQGAKRFYIINNGVSTNQPLKAAKSILEKSYSNLHFQYLDLSYLHEDPRIRAILEQSFGTHADELETSMMLHLAPHLVHLDKAVSEDHEKTHSKSGAWGDPTLATKEKGKIGFMVLQELIDKQLYEMGAQKKS